MTIEAAFFGTLGRDAEAKTSKNGNPYLRFSARDGDGDAAQWITVMYFGEDAAELAPKMLKGARVYVEGSLRLDTWEQDGKQRAGLSVMSFHCRIPAIGRNKPKRERKADNDRATAAAAPETRRDFHNDDLPF
jgi:single-stranded DNA-binding protein